MVLCCHSERVAWVPGREPLMSSCVDTELSKRLGGPFTTRWQGSGVELAHLTLNPGDLSCTQTNIYFFLLSFIRSSGFTFLASKTSRLVLKCSFLSDMANCLQLLFLLPTDSDYILPWVYIFKFHWFKITQYTVPGQSSMTISVQCLRFCDSHNQDTSGPIILKTTQWSYVLLRKLCILYL